MAMNSQALSKEQVLIVGCGDIGTRLALELCTKDYVITGLRRSPETDLFFLSFIQADIHNSHQLAHTMTTPWDVIVITMTPSERSDEGYRKAYVESCQKIISALKVHQQKPRLILFVSSSAVYAQMDGGWVDENSETLPESFSGKRLLEAEAIIQHSGFANTIVRFSGIYGPGRNRLIELVRQGKASASQHYTNRIHADDCARSLAHLIELNRQGKVLQPIYLASDSAPASMMEVVTWLAEQMGVTDFLSPEATNERGNKRCSNQRLLDSGFEFRYPSFKDGYAELI